MCGFEYDNNKSISNLKKHGIDFGAAQELWADPELTELQVKSEDEPRFLVIGLMAKKHWSAVRNGAIINPPILLAFLLLLMRPQIVA